MTDNEKTLFAFFFLTSISVSLLLFSSYKDLDEANRLKSQFFDESYACQQELEETESDLYDTESNFLELEDMVSNATYSTWGTYEDMGNALEELEGYSRSY